MSTDDRLAKLPLWAQEEIRKLRGDVAALRDVEAQLLEELHGIAADETDTMLELPESGIEKPLGNGVSIRFADFYTVRYSDPGSGGRVLFITTDQAMAILPTTDPHEIIVRRA